MLVLISSIIFILFILFNREINKFIKSKFEQLKLNRKIQKIKIKNINKYRYAIKKNLINNYDKTINLIKSIKKVLKNIKSKSKINNNENEADKINEIKKDNTSEYTKVVVEDVRKINHIPGNKEIEIPIKEIIVFDPNVMESLSIVVEKDKNLIEEKNE